LCLVQRIHLLLAWAERDRQTVKTALRLVKLQLVVVEAVMANHLLVRVGLPAVQAVAVVTPTKAVELALAVKATMAAQVRLQPVAVVAQALLVAHQMVVQAYLLALQVQL
jgi:hypothetical protein